MNTTITFSPRNVTKDLLLALPDRSRDVLVARFGLNKDGARRTLEDIGSDYGITRERVRQIEAHGFADIQASEAYARHKDAIAELERSVRALGGILSEDIILEELPKNKQEKQHVQFLLTVGHPFVDLRENTNFVRRWHVDTTLAEKVETALETLHEAVDPDNLIPEGEFIERFTSCLKKTGVKERDESILKRWLGLTKQLGRNPLGEWGRATSPNVRVKSMRDLAYLTLKRHGSPMHFTEVAQNIEKIFKRPAHPATCHNELIKDKRFVLVGRGLYGLEEWGYKKGVVRDVIKEVLEAHGPLSREDIIDRVKRERYVKDATILVNLQDPAFVRAKDGLYTLA